MPWSGRRISAVMSPESTRSLRIQCVEPEPKEVRMTRTPSVSARIAVVGDFNPKNPTHRFTNAALDHLRLGFDWMPTDAVGDKPDATLAGYEGLWIAPASPYRDMEGALSAIRYARERGVPLVGT